MTKDEAQTRMTEIRTEIGTFQATRNGFLDAYLAKKGEFNDMTAKIASLTTQFKILPVDVQAAKQEKFNAFKQSVWQQANTVKFERDTLLSKYREAKAELSQNADYNSLWDQFREVKQVLDPTLVTQAAELSDMLDAMEEPVKDPDPKNPVA